MPKPPEQHTTCKHPHGNTDQRLKKDTRPTGFRGEGIGLCECKSLFLAVCLVALSAWHVARFSLLAMRERERSPYHGEVRGSILFVAHQSSALCPPNATSQRARLVRQQDAPKHCRSDLACDLTDRDNVITHLFTSGMIGTSKKNCPIPLLVDCITKEIEPTQLNLTGQTERLVVGAYAHVLARNCALDHEVVREDAKEMQNFCLRNRRLHRR